MMETCERSNLYIRFCHFAGSSASYHCARFEDDSAACGSGGIKASKRQLLIVTHKAFKGEIMRKQYLNFLIALIGVAGLGVAAKGQDIDQVLVKVPHEFVVGDQTLPAGNYKVERVAGLAQRELVLSNLDNHTSTLVIPIVMESSSADKPSFSFEQVGGELFLSKIKSADHTFTVLVSRSEILEAAARSHSGTSASGSSAGSK
jgi:hypothetical protein